MPASVLAPRDSWYSSKIEIRRLAIHGRGTFATERIGAGEVVEVWGQRTDGRTTVRYTRDGEAVARARRERRVVMQWDDHLFSIEEKGADDGYFLNHGSRKNPPLSRSGLFAIQIAFEVSPAGTVQVNVGWDVAMRVPDAGETGVAAAVATAARTAEPMTAAAHLTIRRRGTP